MASWHAEAHSESTVPSSRVNSVAVTCCPIILRQCRVVELTLQRVGSAGWSFPEISGNQTATRHTATCHHCTVEYWGWKCWPALRRGVRFNASTLFPNRSTADFDSASHDQLDIGIQHPNLAQPHALLRLMCNQHVREFHIQSASKRRVVVVPGA